MSWWTTHGSWSYTTLVAWSSRRPDVRPRDGESDELRWWAVAEVDQLALHSGFRGAWPRLRDLVATVDPGSAGVS